MQTLSPRFLTVLAFASLTCLASPAARAGQLWISHGGNLGSGGGPAGQVGVYTAPTTFTPVQSYGRVSGLAAGNGRIYAYVGAGFPPAPGQLKTLDASTGNEVASITEPLNTDGNNGGHLTLGDLAVDPTTGLLWGASAFGSTAGGVPQEWGLYTIDPADGSRTFVGSPWLAINDRRTQVPGFNPYNMSIAFDASGELYGAFENTDYVVHLDKTDGTLISGSTLTLPAGAAKIGIGLGFDFDSGLLVANYETTADTYSGLLTIDSANGFATAVLGDFGDSRSIHDIAYVPEPTTLVLLVLGGMALLRCRGATS